MSFLGPKAEPDAAPPVDRDWWRGAVLYQIYPRSFQDSNGDGVGDISGIIHRLPHVASLGVDAIWISPFFRSPMLDFGYDVSDYRDVDPLFGTLGDFDALIQNAHRLGLRVMIDLVLSHTSDQHQWFQESRASRDNPKADWYVWADPKPDGSPPNNWLAIFGGPAWEWDGQRMQYYLHNFLAQQPDLNFHNPAVQDEMLDVARYWMDRGVDGFRLDTVNFYFHDRKLRDNPALPPKERKDDTAPSVNPYNFQDHLYDKSQPENLEFLRRLRRLLDGYPAATTVGEVGDSQRGAAIQAAYTAGSERLHMCYGFDFLSGPPLTGSRVAAVLRNVEAQEGGGGWPCWAFSNHDVARHTSRWSLGPEALKVHAALLLSLRGTACLYQGEELGLTEAYVPFEDLQDPYGKRFWPKFRGRDGCRTPIPWTPDGPHGGFSDVKPWLPMAVEHLAQSVRGQEDDPESLLNFYRAFLAFRRARPVFAKGSIEFVEATEDVVAFVRRHNGERPVYCAFNLGGEARDVEFGEAAGWTPLDAPGFSIRGEGARVLLPPHNACFAEGEAAGR